MVYRYVERVTDSDTPADASKFPSGLNFTEEMDFLCPLKMSCAL
jgi:hypothetical protein